MSRRETLLNVPNEQVETTKKRLEGAGAIVAVAPNSAQASALEATFPTRTEVLLNVPDADVATTKQQLEGAGATVAVTHNVLNASAITANFP